MKFANFDLAEKFTQDSKELIKLNADFDKYYSEYTWDYTMKKNSLVIAKLMPYVSIFNQLNISLDRVIVTLCALEYYATICHQSSFFELPDRFLTLRNQKSKYTTNQIIYILSKINLIDTKFENGKIYVKLNRKELADDIYFQHQCERFTHTNKKKLDECIYKKDSVKYFKQTNYTINKHIRHSVLGLTIAYNMIVQECLLKDDKFSNYNQRLDIQYLELPIQILCRELKFSEKRLRNYITKLERYSDYFAKHNLAYTDVHNMEGNLIEHWFNPNGYKKTRLVDVKKLEAEYGKPLITRNSYILFTDKFERTSTGKAVLKNIEVYKDIVKRHLAFMNVDKLNGEDEEIYFDDEDYSEDTLLKEDKTNSDDYNNFDSSEDSISKKYSTLTDKDKEYFSSIYSGETQIGSIIDVDKMHQLRKKEIKNLILPNKEKIQCLGIKKTISLLEQVVAVMSECDKYKIKYYLKKFNELLEHFNIFKEEYTKLGTFDSYLPQIYNSGLGLLLN